MGIAPVNFRAAWGGSGPFLTCGARGQLGLCSCSRCADVAASGQHGMHAGSPPMHPSTRL
eukprot:SAG31_NODE_31747_length_364_cov_1.716981_1_plen_59_part_01